MMPDAMMNGGFSPYLAQAFTPQGVPGGLFGGGMGNLPTSAFNNPISGQSYAQPGMLGGLSQFAGMPQWGQQYSQPYTSWQQQIPQLPIAQLLGQYQQQYSPQQAFSPFGGQGQFGQLSGDVWGRIPPFLAQQGLTGQGFGTARV